jgi:hypothetical protein
MSGKYSLQYASNFFLDLHKRNMFWKMLIPSSENLVLLGNISRTSNLESLQRYKLFLDYCSRVYKNVYIVPGPWEYCASNTPFLYSHNIKNLFNLSKNYNNVRILDNSHVSIPNTNINLIGSTLWLRNPYMKHQCMFEYKYIWLNRHSGLGNIMGEDMVNWHVEDLQYIRDSTNANNKYIVLTHHLPHPILVKELGRKRMETNNLEKHMKKPIEIWLGGAGDTSVSGTFGVSRDVFCATNPYTTFNLAKHSFIETYNPEAFVSLRTDTIELV